jgi:hypothetical protein
LEKLKTSIKSLCLIGKSSYLSSRNGPFSIAMFKTILEMVIMFIPSPYDTLFRNHGGGFDIRGVGSSKVGIHPKKWVNDLEMMAT